MANSTREMKKRLLRFSKSWFLTAAFLGAGLWVNAQGLSFKISTDNDDAEEEISTGIIDLTSSDLELTADGGEQVVGMRFQNVQIPANAVLTKAYIQFAQDENKDGNTTTLSIKAEKAGNSTVFTSAPFNLSSRTTTDAVVDWTITETWAVENEQTEEQRTPSLISLIEELRTETNWISGNALTFLITGDGNGRRTVESFNGANGGDLTPTLVLEYVYRYEVYITNGDDDVEQVVGVAGLDLSSSDLEIMTEDAPQVIGLRFRDVMLPTAAIIDSAYIQFTVDVKETGDVTALLVGEISTNSKEFTSGEDLMDDANRQFNLGNFVLWNVQEMGEPGDAGVSERTPDVKNIIQDIVSLRGWVSGNALMIGMIDPHWVDGTNFPDPTNGQREVESFNGAVEDHAEPTRAAKLVVYYRDPISAPTGSFPVSTGTTWKYDYSATALATEWTELNYEDATWKFGTAPIGIGEGQATELKALEGVSPVTAYFRQNFIVNPGVTAEQDSIIYRIKADDGAIVYLNGVEQFRINMPAGAVDQTTLATSEVADGDEGFVMVTVKNKDLIDGENIIAVEVHKASLLDEDIDFDLEIRGKLPPLANGTFPINKYAAWSYLDNGTDKGTDWINASYEVTNWSYGNGPLGYGDPSTTELGFGTDPDNKFITYYFRKTIDIADVTKLPEEVDFGVNADDGAVVYLNGTEIFRINMPEGAVDYLTVAAGNVSGSDESRYFIENFKSADLPFVNGENVIAVEVHQDRSTSSDLSFDLELRKAVKPATPPAVGFACDDVLDPHFSCFTSLQPDGQDQLINFPATHNFQVIVEEGDVYTKQKDNVPTSVGGNNDFTGYAPLNGSSRNGVVSINHETSPGGVTMVDLHFDETTGLWSVDETQGVDFSVVQGTVRLCSGGVTPWGTIITSEESLSSNDADNDGHMDIGWQIELDPVTKTVMDYGNGPQKLWEAGRISHENIVVAKDSLTAYEGEDSGSGNFFKFVADNKTDFSTGTLYVLSLGSNLVDGEPVVTTGTWIEVPNKTVSDQNNTKSIAYALGGTVFSGVEDAEINPVTGQVYFTAKGNNRTYRFTDNGSTVSDFETFVGGKNYLINDGTEVVEEPWASGNDNLTFDDRGNLYVLQDGSDNYIWFVGKDHTQEQPQVSIFARFPSGSEPTGMTFTPDNRYAFVSVQHPSGANGANTQLDAANYEATMAQSTTVVVSRKEFLGEEAIVTSVIDEQSGATVFSAYPNPSNGDVTIDFNVQNSAIVHAQLFDIQGKPVSEITNQNYFSGNHKVEVKGLEPGVYILNVRIGEQSYAKTVVVK